jgi:exosortase
MIRINKQSSVFLALMAVSLLAGWRPLFETFELALQNDTYTHILLILPVSLFMILAERRLLVATAPWSLRAGAAVLLAAATIASSAWIWTASLAADTQLAIRIFALVLSWIGFFLLSYGIELSRKLMFPLLFLFGLVPLPRIVMDPLIALLQIGSAWSAHAFFAAFGVPVFQQGVILTIPGLIVQVAQECSSIRSSSMLIVTSLVMAQVLLRSFWRKAVVVAVAVPLSVFKNGLRIFIIAMLGTRVDPGYLTGRLHHQGGSVFLAIALGGTLALLWLLRRGEHLELVSRLKPLRPRTTGG